MKEFFKSKVNFFLFLIMIVLLVAFSALATVYNMEFRSLNKETATVSKNLSTCSQNLDKAREDLAGAKSQLNMSSKDIESFEEIYQEKTEEVGTKQLQIDKLTADLAKTRTESTTFKKYYLDTKALLDSANLNLQNCKDEKAELQDDLSECNHDLDDCEENCTP